MFKNLAEAFQFIKSAPKADIDAMLRDASLTESLRAELLKAAQSLRPGEFVQDHWQEGQVNGGAKANEIKTGPAQSASGSGAERMINAYSTPTPQVGTTLTAESLERITAPLVASSKAMTEAVASLTGVVGSLVTKKAEDEKKEEDKKDEEKKEDDFTKSANIKAELLFKKGKNALEKAEFEDDAVLAKSYRDKAVKFLSKSLGQSYLAGNAGLREQIVSFAKAEDLAIKADTDTEEKKEEKKEEGEAAKAGATDDKGAVSDNQAPNNQATSKGENLRGEIDMLKGTVNDLIGALAGKSKGTAMPPSFLKADVGKKAEDLLVVISKARTEGRLQAADAMAASDIVGRMKAVSEGHLDICFVTDRISKSSPQVKKIFEDAFAAAA